MNDGHHWKTKDGRVMLISEMDDTHLKNSIRMIRRGVDYQGDIVSYETKAKLPELIKEYNIRICKLEEPVPEKVEVDKKKYDFIDVRFAKNPDKLYTYKVRKGAKCHLGQQLVVQNSDGGSSLVYVVGINVPGKTGTVEITDKVVRL